MTYKATTDYYSPTSFMRKLYELELNPTLFVDVVFDAREKFINRFDQINIKPLALFMNKKWIYYNDLYALFENEFVISFSQNKERKLTENTDFYVLRIEAATSHFNDLEFHRSKLKLFTGKTDKIIEDKNNFVPPDQFLDILDEVTDYDSYV